MASSKLLLDTNIFISLEDAAIVPASVAALAQKAALYGLSLFLHEASILDVQRDANLTRRAGTLSKLQKFQVLRDIAHRAPDELIARFGSVRNDNDRCDVCLLDTLDLNIVDFLITEDIGIHRRAEGAQLRNRVFTVREAIGWIQRTYEPKDIQLRHIAARKVHQIAADDPLFESLRQDYSAFDAWLLTRGMRTLDIRVRSQAKTAAQLAPAYAEARAIDPIVFAERFISGDEYTVGVLQTDGLPSIRIRPATEFYDYQAKYFRNDTQYHCPSGLDAKAEAEFNEGQSASGTADKYVRLTVFLAAVLFLVGIASHFPVRSARYGLIAIASALLIVSAVQLLGLPGPPS